MKRTAWYRGAISIVLLLLSSFSFVVVASSGSEHTSVQWKSWPTVGKAQLSWFMFDIYESRLKAPAGTYQLADDITPHALALQIDYQRNISRDELLNATAEQWKQLGYSSTRYRPWLAALSGLFPDISKGDQLIYVTDGVEGSLWYAERNHAPKVVGLVSDETLNDAFLSIWLSPRSQYPELRKQLIGMHTK